VSTDAATSPSSITSPAASHEANLPADLTVCHALIRQLLEARVEDARLIEGLQHQLKNLLRRA
jgi:hypothetical protein